MKHRGSILLMAFMAVLIGPVVAVAADSAAPAAVDPQINEWQTIQQMLTKEYGVCLEHCGGSGSCNQKCDKVRTTKMNREHTRLFGQPIPTTAKGGS